MCIRKNTYGLLCLAALLSVLCIKQASEAGVNININLGPPVIAVAAPPEVVLIPGTLVYFVPGGDLDIFFYDGYWWCPRGNRWYCASAYNGPWKIRRHVPIQISRVPLKTYRTTYGREQHIPYGQFRNQWQNKHGNMQGNRQGKNRPNMPENRQGMNRQGTGTNIQGNRPGVNKHSPNMQGNRQGTNVQNNRQGANMQENKPGVNKQGSHMQNNRQGSNTPENRQGNRQDKQENSGGR